MVSGFLLPEIYLTLISIRAILIDGRVVDSGYPSTQTILFCPEDKMKKQHPTSIELLIVSVLGFILGLAFILAPGSYEVWMTWPEKHVVAIYDGHGKKVDPAKIDLTKVRYDVVWVGADYEGDR